MPPEPPKKSLAARFLQRIAGAADLRDEGERRRTVERTVERYLEEYRRSTDSQMARALLNELAVQFEEAGLSPIEIYREAYGRNKADTELLKFIVGEYDREAGDSRGAVESYWALTVAEPSDLRHFLRLIDHYRHTDEPLTLLRIEEQIVDRYLKIEGGAAPGMPPAPDPAANAEIFALALEDLAATYSEMGRVDAHAALVYEQQFRRAPNDNLILEMLARSWLEIGRSDAVALAVYEQYFVLQPQNEKLQRALIESYLENEQPERAVVLMESIFQTADDDFGLLSRIVHYYLSRNIVNEASINYLKRFAEVRSGDRHVLRIIADYYAMREAVSAEAASWYRRAVGEPPSDWTYRLLLARHHLEEERWFEAYELLEPLKSTVRMRGAVLIAFATSLSHLDRLDAEAAVFYERAIAEGSRSRSIYTSLCRSYVRLKRFDPAALRVFEETTELDPNNAWAYFGMAAYYFRLDEPQNAFRYAVRHVRNNRDDDAGIQLAGLALARTLSEEALLLLETLPSRTSLRILQAALTESPHDARILLPLARVYYHTQEASETALAVFRNLAHEYPEDVVVRDRAAALALELGHEEEGLRHLRRLALQAGRTELASEFEDDAERLRVVVQAALRRMTTILLNKKVLGPEDEPLLRLALRMGSRDPLLFRRLALLGAERNEYGAEILPVYEEALRHYPELTTLKHLLMRCYIAIGQSAPVFQHARELLELGPFNNIVLNLVIDCLASADCYDEDLHDLICEHARRDPRHARTTIAYALLNHRANRCDAEAAVVFERAIGFADNELKVMLLTALARCLEVLGEHDRALAVYERIVPIIPDDKDILRRLALNHVLHAKTSTGGAEMIRQALADGPYDTELYFHLAELFLNRREVRLLQFVIDRIQQDDPAASLRLVDVLERAMRLGLSGPALAAQLAEHYFLSGDRDKALAQIDEMPVPTPEQAGMVIELYNIMLAQDGDDLEVRRRRGELLAVSGDRLSAVEDLLAYWEIEGAKRPLPDGFLRLLEQCVAEATTVHPRLLLMMARSFYRAARYDAAVRLCRRLAVRDGHHPEARELLARCHLQMGDLELALRAALRLPPGAPRHDLLYRLACDLTTAHAYDRAEAAIATIIDQQPDFRDCRRRAHHLAAVRTGRAGREEEARQQAIRHLGPRARERFDIVGELGRTPFRAVYKAYDRELDEIVALKVISPAFNAIPAAVTQFTAQARAVRRLSHPYIARIRDVGEGHGLAFIAMEYLGRGSLAQALRRGELTLADKLRVAAQVAEGLDFLHRHEIIHRKLTPENVVLADFGTAKLTDVGLAALYQESALMSPDLRVDDPRFAAPETLHQREYSAATDIYAFGLVLYTMLAGAPPFEGGNIVQKQLAMPPRPLDHVPSRLNEVLAACLQKRSIDRYPTMREALHDLQSVPL